MQLIIVSGLSGAGKTVALKRYEDLGWYCIDNLPLGLIQPLVAQAIASPEPRFERVAIGIDARATNAEIENFPHTVDSLREQGIATRVMFLTASDRIILARYNDTRRKHPLSTVEVSLAEAVALERRILKPVADLADETLDTSTMNAYDLGAALRAQLPAAGQTRLALTLISFGYKHGIPDGVDFIFDARCLPNPYWVPGLRSLSGHDPAVTAWLAARPDVREYEGALRHFLQRWLPVFQSQGRPYVTVAIGCTGGRHRSVYLVDRLAAELRSDTMTLASRHRETP